jgi:hypothetical protein
LSVVRYANDPPVPNLTWLVGEIRWEGALCQIALVDPWLTAEDLRGVATKLQAFASGTAEPVLRLRFSEPILEIDLRRSAAAATVEVNILVYGEPACVGERLEIPIEIDEDRLQEFAHRVAAWASRFPPRA